AVDGDAGLLQQAEPAADLNEPRADLSDRRPVVLPEISNGLEVGRQSSEQPNDLEIATGLALKAPARMHAVEIAVDVELQVHRRMVGGPAGLGSIDAVKAQTSKIETVDEGIDEANRIALVDPVIEALWQQRCLSPIRPFDEPRHPSPRRFSKGIIAGAGFSHDQGHSRRASRL